MFMLYESMAWTCLFSSLGIPVPLRRNSVSSTLFLWDIGEQPKDVERLISKGMKKVKLYITASIDGYIARPDGDLEWLTGFPNPSKTDYGYKDFFDSVDTVIMGNRTYHDILCMDVLWPYKDKETYVVTHHAQEAKENIRFISENVVETISELRKKDEKDIWLVGGGQLVSLLLSADLIDEMQITYIPVILSNGIPLFPKSTKESQWNLLENRAFDNGVFQVKYQRKA